jgi:hypothetical protein
MPPYQLGKRRFFSPCGEAFEQIGISGGAHEPEAA